MHDKNFSLCDTKVTEEWFCIYVITFIQNHSSVTLSGFGFTVHRKQDIKKFSLTLNSSSFGRTALGL